MSDLIRREDAYKIAKKVVEAISDKQYSKFLLAYDIMDWIDDIPAVDAVEVVRCADCKYYHTEWDGTQEHYEDDYWCQWVEPNEDDYCSLGQRREDGDGDG